jgi:DNA-binding response OmpR family regulator
MKHSIIIITDEIIFPQLFIYPLYLKMDNDVHIEICNSFDDIDHKLVTLNCELILLDGGVDTCTEIIRRIRCDSETDVPIWFFSEVRHEKYNMRTLASGASRIIKKPFDPDLICFEIKTLLVGRNNDVDD